MVKKKLFDEDDYIPMENAKEDKTNKAYAQEAHDLLKVIGKWCVLKNTSPSPYKDIHEATRKFLEGFKK